MGKILKQSSKSIVEPLSTYPEMRVLGIDPGQSGGLCLIQYRGLKAKVVAAIKMPETETDLAKFLRGIKKKGIETTVYLELVQGMPNQAHVATWKFGQNYGMIRGMLAALKFRREFVRPQAWQKEMKCLSKGDKNVTKRRAQELFIVPFNITHALADAMLIAEYGRRQQIKIEGY